METENVVNYRVDTIRSDREMGDLDKIIFYVFNVDAIACFMMKLLREYSIHWVKIRINIFSHS